MPGVTFAPPLLGIILGFAVVMGALFYGAVRDEALQIDDDERRSRHVPDDEIDTDYASGGE